MAWLVAIGLTNALLATALASAALLATWLRRPAMAHLLWVLVLCKLLTPPLIKISVEGWGKPGGWLDPAMWTNAPVESIQEVATAEPTGLPRGIPTRPGVAEAAAVQTPMTLDDRRLPTAPVARPPQLLAATRRWWKSSPSDWLRVAALVWMSGSVVTVVLLGRRAWRFRAFLRLAAHRDHSLSERVARVARAVGIASPPGVLVVESVVSPMLWGVGRGAQLLLPGPLVRRLDDAARDALVLHELAHYARGDCWVRLLELTVRVLYWWHPLVRWAMRAIEAAEEECCDAWVLEHQSGTRRSYAEALLTTIDFLCEPAPARSPLALPPAASGLGDVPVLRSRLRQIMCGDVATRPSHTARLLVLVAAAVLLPLGPAFLGTAANSASARSTAFVDFSISANVAEADVATDGSSWTIVPGRSAAVDLGTSSHDEAVGSSESERSSSPLPPATARIATAQLPRLPAVLWATATSPNGKYKLEARAGRRTTLVHVESGWRLDLSSYKIACVSFAPDSRTVATGHDDSVVRIWDCETGGILYSLKGSEAAISSLAIAGDGRRLAAGAADGSVLVWDLSSGEQLGRLARQDAAVSCIRWSHAGDRLAVALGRWSDHEQASLVIWSPDEGDVSAQHTLGDPAGALDWLANDESLLLAGWDGEGRIWRLGDAAPSGWMALAKDVVSAAAWSPDCPLISSWQNEQLASGAGSEFDDGME
ncbi:MAG TPA: M56 family metallopeptidase [Pirellulales bacterium]|nr:M56 family metallopeptidase [Pirellulales bacterium]